VSGNEGASPNEHVRILAPVKSPLPNLRRPKEGQTWKLWNGKKRVLWEKAARGGLFSKNSGGRGGTVELQSETLIRRKVRSPLGKVLGTDAGVSNEFSS